MINVESINFFSLNVVFTKIQGYILCIPIMDVMGGKCINNFHSASLSQT